MKRKYLDPISPGEVLLEEFLKPCELSRAKLARSIHVPANRINQIVDGSREITADTAVRLAKYFGNSAQFWLNLQTQYKLEKLQPLIPEITKNIHQYDSLAA